MEFASCAPCKTCPELLAGGVTVLVVILCDWLVVMKWNAEYCVH